MSFQFLSVNAGASSLGMTNNGITKDGFANDMAQSMSQTAGCDHSSTFDPANTASNTAMNGPTQTDADSFFKALVQPEARKGGTQNPVPKNDTTGAGCYGRDQSPMGRSMPQDDAHPTETVHQILQVIGQLIELLQNGDTPNNAGRPELGGPSGNPAMPAPPKPDLDQPIANNPSNGQPILTNTVLGGTGKPQRDMDANQAGTQINVVLDKNMSQDDRAKSLESLKRWEDASKGELDFTVYEQGQQPGGEDYTVMRAVKPDNTNQAGVADVGRSPDGVTELEFESGTDLAVVMHEIGHTLGLRHGDGVLKAVNASDKFSEQNLADLAALYPNMRERSQIA